MNPERFWSLVTKGATPRSCWLWNGGTTSGGYGHAWIDGKMQLAHRYVYERLVRSIPPRTTIDHLCRVHNCVNPVHMDLASGRENTRRGVSPAGQNARKNYCKRGHPLWGDNLYHGTDGSRHCRICNRLWQRNRWTRIHPPKPPRDRCAHGHLLTPDNVYVNPKGRRQCRQCLRTYSRNYEKRTSRGSHRGGR